MKATPTHGSQAPSSAHGTARTAASSNRHTYLSRHPSPYSSQSQNRLSRVKFSSWPLTAQYSTGRRLSNSDSTQSIRAVRVTTCRSANASAFNRQQRASRTAAARSLEHCLCDSDYSRNITELSQSLLVSQPSSQRPTTYVWARPRKGIESAEPEPFRVVIIFMVSNHDKRPASLELEKYGRCQSTLSLRARPRCS